MDRTIIYSGQAPQTTDLLTTNKQTMIALAKLCSDLFGTATVATGLACVPTSPASMSVNVNPGQIYQLANVDGTAYSAINADTTHSILKQGILLDAQSFALTAPGTVGYSQNYLIQATYLDNDINNTVLPYYNSANPSQAFNGPGGNGTAQPTTRAGQVSLQLVAGTAATTGTQTTPAVTTGYVGLWVITVANGQSTITSSNIAAYPSQPILPSSILAAIQTGNLSYGVATGTANAHTVALTPALTARVDGMVIRYKAPAANTGALTLNDGLGAVSVVGGAHAALQGGETVANGDVWVQWNSSIGGGSYIMLDSSGGALQTAPATQSQHALQLGQATGRLLRTTIYTINAGTQQVSVDGGSFSSTGATTFTPLALTSAVEVEVVGGGAAGGGAQATSGTNVSLGPGGGSGAYGRGRFSSGFSGATITVGAAGAGASGVAGGNGGVSSFGALLSAPGGIGGPQGVLQAPPYSLQNFNTAAAPSGANLISAGGVPGGIAVATSSSQGASGCGASSVWGGGGRPAGYGLNTSIAGNAGTAPGAGGSGGTSGATASASAGGNGAAGMVVVREYA